MQKPALGAVVDPGKGRMLGHVQRPVLGLVLGSVRLLVSIHLRSVIAIFVPRLLGHFLQYKEM